jgi:hypothetical protein
MQITITAILRLPRVGHEAGLSSDLMIQMTEHKSCFRTFVWQKDVPWTNNGTEQCMKMRSRSVRGYKTKSGMLAGLILAGSGVG